MPTLSSAELDHKLGLKFYITSTRPIGGRIRVRLEDFIVEEINSHLKISDKPEAYTIIKIIT